MESGIEDERINLSKGRNWFKVNVTVEEAESLLRTQYHVYTNVQTGKDHLACDDYSVPVHIKEHIDFITPTVHFGMFHSTVKFTTSEEPKRSSTQKPPHLVHVNPNPHTNPHIDATVKQKKQRRDLQTREMKVKPFPIIHPNPNAAPQPQITYSLANCDEYITPDCLRALYNFTNGTLAV